MAENTQVSWFSQMWSRLGFGGIRPVAKRPDALRIGILGAANIAPKAVIVPASKLDSVVIASVAARDKSKAESFASKHGIAKVYSSYDELLADKDVDAVYIPLPNGKHCEYSIKALRAGKHVLCEKPMASNEAEARLMQAEAEKSNLVLMEAFHNRYHPVFSRLRELLDSANDVGGIGQIQQVQANMKLPSLFNWFAFGADDIRYNFDLAGGIMMDAGCYVVNAVRFASRSNVAEVIEATPTALVKPRVEAGMRAQLRMENDVKASIEANFQSNTFDFGLHILGDKGQIHLNNFVVPHMFHSLRVESRDEKGVIQSRTEKHYGDGSTSYDHQLRAFVNAVQNRAPFETTSADAVKNMAAVDSVYDKAGLPRRGPNNPQI